MAKTAQQKGMVLAIYMPDELHLLVVQGRETEDALIDYMRQYFKDLPNNMKDAFHKYNKIWSNKNLTEREQFVRSRAAYTAIRQWLNKERAKRADVPNPKRDRLGLVGGKIWPDEFTDHPNDYGDWALARETVEESGLIVVDKDTKSNLFHLVGRYWEQDHDAPVGNFTYENLVYWVNEAQSAEKDQMGFPKPHDRGVKEETFAAFYIDVKKLGPHNFHRKHAQIVRDALRKRTELEYGWHYRPALEHFEAAFPVINSLRKERVETLETEIECANNASDEEEFAKAMAGVKPLAK